MDREKIIQRIAAAMATLEKCSEADIGNTKKFLRWMPDNALIDMWRKHEKALEKRTPVLTRK